MSTLYFGDYAGTPTGAWGTLSNWFINPGVYCSCCGGSAGTPAAALPTPADTVVLLANVTSVPAPGVSGWTAGGKWTGPITLAKGSILNDWYTGAIVTVYEPFASGSGTPQIALGGATCSAASITNNSYLRIDSGTFPCPITFNVYYLNNEIYGGTFNGTLSPTASGATGFKATGGTFNGLIALPNSGVTLDISGSAVVNSTFSTSGASASLAIVANGGTWNVPFPSSNNATSYIINSPTLGFAGGMVLGTAGKANSFDLAITTSKNIVMNGIAGVGAGGSYVKFSAGGNYTGLLTLPALQSGRLSFVGTSAYSPPAVTTPAIKSGNNMTFAGSAVPTDPGFKANGGTFSPTMLLSGTSNDILGAGLQ